MVMVPVRLTPELIATIRKREQRWLSELLRWRDSRPRRPAWVRWLRRALRLREETFPDEWKYELYRSIPTADVSSFPTDITASFRLRAGDVIYVSSSEAREIHSLYVWADEIVASAITAEPIQAWLRS